MEKALKVHEIGQAPYFPCSITVLQQPRSMQGSIRSSVTGSIHRSSSEFVFEKYDSDATVTHSLLKQGPSQPVSSSWNFLHLRWMCLGLHIILVLVHLLLLAVQIPHLEHHILITLAQSNLTSLCIIVTLQAFITFYSAALVVTTQQLALRQNLLTRQTLTATHDKVGAWNGLGSALLSLYRQASIAASVWGILAVTTYLGGVTILHITTPSLFNLQIYNAPNYRSTNTTMGLPVVTLKTDGSSGMTSPFKFWYDKTPLMTFMGRIDDASKLGAHNGTLYDVLQGGDNGVGEVVVNSTTFNVTCGSLENVTAHTLNSSPPLAATWLIQSIYEDYQFNFTVPVMSSRVVRGVYGPGGTTLLGRNYIFYATMNFTDTAGSIGSVVALDSPMVPLFPSTDHNITSLQLFGCSLALINRTATVNSTSKQLISIQGHTDPDMSYWQRWEPQKASNSNHWPFIADPLLDSWSDIFNFGAASSHPYASECPGDSGCQLTVVEQYIMGNMGLYPDYLGNSGSGTPGNVTLQQLENALSSMTAAAFWAASRIADDDFNPSGVDPSPESHILLETGSASITGLMYQLNLNIIPIILGLGCSISLLLLSVGLTRHPNTSRSGIDVGSAGVLQLIWLLRDQHGLQEHISRVNVPSVDDLRAAGMKLELRMADVGDPAVPRD